MSKLEEQLNKLNPQQRKAVETTEGPVLVVAGPGTGKTQVLALRIGYILKNRDVNPSNILCLTFTESGVVAMRQRLSNLIGKESTHVKIHTFHSFCNEIIQTFPDKFIFKKELSMLSDMDQVKIIRELIDKTIDEHNDKYLLINSNDKYSNKSVIIEAIKTLKREDKTAKDLKDISNDNIRKLEENPKLNKKTGKPINTWTTELKRMKKNLELAEFYEKYNESLLEKGLYDYEDMIIFVINKFKEDEELLSYYQENFLYILVDEYQDTNGAQNELLKILTSFDKSPNIFAVGDDDQAVFRFQGANVENLLMFNEIYDNVKTISIDINYRSSQLILDASQSLIENNNVRLVNKVVGLEKKLKAGLNIANNKIEVYDFTNNSFEVRFIANKIKELKNNGVKYSEIGILFRKNNDSIEIVEELLKEEIPINFVAGKNILINPIVDKFITLLKVIQHSGEDRNFLLLKILYFDFLNLNRIDSFKITRSSTDNRTEIFNIISDEEILNQIKVSNKDLYLNLANNIVKWHADFQNLTLTEAIQNVINESGLLKYIFKEPIIIDNINAINTFYSFIKESNRKDTNMNLKDFLNEIQLHIDEKISITQNDIEIQKDAVNLMTAHRSKGLEFKYVFIYKFNEKNWGKTISNKNIKLPDEIFFKVEDKLQKKEDEIEDERRLFFVALTRAKEQVYLTFSKNILDDSNEYKEQNPSPFYNELKKDLLNEKEVTKYELQDLEYTKKKLEYNRLEYSVEEKEYLKELVQNLTLSITKLNTYIECPLKFKFRYLFNAIETTTDTNLIQGTAMHFALEQFFKKFGNESVDLNYLKEMYKLSISKKILNENDRKLLLNNGLDLITRYYNKYHETFTTAAAVEYNFYNIVFEIPNSEHIFIKGKIDKLEWVDKNSNLIRIVDYKTTVPKSENNIKGLTKDSDGSIYRQLVFYEILAESDKNFKNKINGRRYLISDVQVDFLKPNNNDDFKKLSFNILSEDKTNLKNLIYDIVKRIRNLEFSGSDEYPLCHECEYCKLLGL